MFTKAALHEIYGHMEWADAQVWKSLPADGIADQVLKERLVHIHVVQRAFLYAWTGGPVGEAFKSGADFVTLADVRNWALPYYAEARGFFEALDEQRLDEPLTLPWAAMIAESLGQTPAPTTLGETCFQIPNHTTHHRGQVCARMRELGIEPPLVDYIAWVWLGKADAVWQAGVGR